MKIAIIGYGGMGNNHKKYIIQRHNDSNYPEKLDIAGIFDIDEARCEFARELGLHVFDSAEQIYDDSSIEAVLVATPNDLHLPYVLASLGAGKHVICEKPMAMNSDEVKQMFAAAKRAGRVLEVHQNRRWDDDYVSVRSIYNNGEIGRVYRVESRVMGSNGIPGAWRRNKNQGGGMMLDWGVHLIDQMLQMIEGKITSLYCTYSFEAGEEVDDGFDLEVRFDSGVVYRIVVDTNCFVELPRWQLYGVDGTATVTGWRRDMVEGRTVRVVLRHDEKLEGVNAGNGFTKTMAARRQETVDDKPLEVVRGDKCAYYHGFMDTVLRGAKPIVTEEQVLRVFAVMEAAAESARKNRVIKKSI